MISPSKRRGPELQPDATFRLHLVTARRLAGSERVRRAAYGALAAAVVVGLIKLLWPVGLAVHLGATVLGAIGAALIPVAPQTRRALDQIARTTGLAYESALAIIDSRAEYAGTVLGDQSDAYGLEASVIGRAKRSVADFKPEQGPQWWLPVSVVALAVVLLSQFLPTATNAGGTVGAGPTTTANNSDSTLPQPLEELVPALPASSRADAPEVPDSLGGAADSRDALPPGGSDAGNDALSRFLEALKQGQSASEPGAGQGGPGDSRDLSEQVAPEGARMPQPTTPGDAAETTGATATAEAAGEGAGQSQNDAERSSPDAQTQAGAETGKDETQPDAEGNSGQQVAGGGRTQEEGRGDRGLTEDDEVAAGPGAGDEQGPGAGDEASAGVGGGEDGPEGTAGAGGAELADDGVEPDALFSAAGAQLLPGVLLDGPTTPAGNVRLPGDDQVELPPGTAFAPYATAVEEALGEGDLPAGYQEIIRRYFR